MAAVEEKKDPGSFTPYVSDGTVMPEFTLQAVVVGALLGIVFGASSLYLVLKVGMTVSASIPVAVLSITLFRLFAQLFGRKPTTILENNIVQTAGSAGESIAFGVGVTMPALLLIGYEIGLLRVMVVSLLGGLLGVLMMIPLRRAFIVKMHGKPGQPGTLLYPEGTACAQVLISGEKGGTSGMTVFVGFGLAFLQKLITEGMNLLRGTVAVPLQGYSKAAAISGEMAPELLGVGYIIGVRTSSIMMAGAVIGSLVILPTIYLFGSSMTTPLPPAKEAMSQISEDKIQGFLQGNYLRFIGAGCVAAAGIISMSKTLPMIFRSFRSGIGSMSQAGSPVVHTRRRTEDDLPGGVVLGGALLLLALLAAFLNYELNSGSRAILGAILVLLFGFLFVTVSSRLTGEIGSSSNPISGMTVATLLMTCLIFLAMGMTSRLDAVLALSIAGVVCIAASNGGTTSQDLKTGYLVGGTPRLQQIAILIGALTSALVIGGTLLLFNSAGTIYSARNLPALNLRDQMKDWSEVKYQDEVYRVWRPSREQIAQEGFGPEYLVDSNGQICYLVDPTITGKVKNRDIIKPVPDSLHVKLKPEERDLLTETMSQRKGGTLFTMHIWNHKKPEGATRKEPEKGIPYGAYPDVPEGEYLVDGEGTVVSQVEKEEVKLKFDAPKTQVMGIIINGVLGGKLNWTMILIGAFLAVGLELCGVSSLAFAVGLYVPMAVSTPIFLGGLIRWVVDSYLWSSSQSRLAKITNEEERARAEVQEIARTETSSGVLMASGLIAGGSMAGVMLAFFEFSPALKNSIDMASKVAGTLLDPKGTGLEYLLPSLGIFAGLMLLLLLAGLGVIFRQPRTEETATGTK